MISCPACQEENEQGAKTCQACGKELPVAADSALPPWLQALKPDEAKKGDTAILGGTLSLETSDLAPTPAPAPVAAGAHAPISDNIAPFEAPLAGTDTLVATQPTPAARTAAPARAKSAPAKSGAKDDAQVADTASLISEDDLPAWLRAYSETVTSGAATNADDQSWMLGTNGATAADTSDELAQTWQAPVRAQAQRSTATAAFAPTTSAAKVAKAARPSPAPVVPPAPVAPAAKAIPEPGALPARLGANRPMPAAPRGNSSVQRVAIIAFILALVVFLIVLGIFVIKPALLG